MTPIVLPYAEPGYYSPHFSRREMFASETAARRGIDNTPPAHAEANLARLCVEFLENLRARFGPLRVTSGYRCLVLNTLIGGSSSSAHIDGRAADLQPLRAGVSLKQMMDWVLASPLDFDQVILEYGGWVHLGIARVGEKPRRQALMIFRGTDYLPYESADSRVETPDA